LFHEPRPHEVGRGLEEGTFHEIVNTAMSWCEINTSEHFPNSDSL
jgi:hypothetical protein